MPEEVLTSSGGACCRLKYRSSFGAKNAMDKGKDRVECARIEQCKVVDYPLFSTDPLCSFSFNFLQLHIFAFLSKVSLFVDRGYTCLKSMAGEGQQVRK